MECRRLQLLKCKDLMHWSSEHYSVNMAFVQIAIVPLPVSNIRIIVRKNIPRHSSKGFLINQTHLFLLTNRLSCRRIISQVTFLHRSQSSSVFSFPSVASDDSSRHRMQLWNFSPTLSRLSTTMNDRRLRGDVYPRCAALRQFRDR